MGGLPQEVAYNARSIDPLWDLARYGEGEPAGDVGDESKKRLQVQNLNYKGEQKKSNCTSFIRNSRQNLPHATPLVPLAVIHE